MIAPPKWIKAAARAGYASRGVVYAIIGFFALLASMGADESEDTKGALQKVLEQPFGTLLVAILILGLLGFVVWRLLQAIWDADQHGHGLKALVVRMALFVSALTYFTLSLYAINLTGLLPFSSGGSAGFMPDSVLEFLHPRLVATALVLVFLGIALAHWWKALSGKFRDNFKQPKAPMAVITVVSVAGLVARGFVFLILASMLWFGAATSSSPIEDPPGIKDALQYVQQLQYGQQLLFCLAVGLLLFAAYSFAEAMWRKVNTAGYEPVISP